MKEVYCLHNECRTLLRLRATGYRTYLVEQPFVLSLSKHERDYYNSLSLLIG